MLKPDTAFPRDAEFLDYIRSFVDESRLSGAAVDRLFALARRGAEASEASNLRGMVRHHQDQTTALRAEVERLRMELDTWKSVFPDIAPERVLPDRSKLEAEVERLRAALRQIAGIDVWDNSEQGYVDKARAALEGRT